MRDSLPWGMLALVLLLAGWARSSAVPWLGGSQDAREGARLLALDDPQGAHWLRRATVAVAEGRVPDFDGALAFGGTGELPWPPLYPGLLARAAQLVTASGASGDAAAGVSEALIEDLALALGPLAGLATTAAVFLALLALTSRAAPGLRLAAATLGAGLYALWPPAVVLESGRAVGPAPLLALGTALALGLAARGALSRDRTELTLLGMVAGLVIGLTVLTDLAACALLPLLPGSFLVRALWGARELAASVRRAGFLCGAVAAVVVMVPAERSPWNTLAPGSVQYLGEPLALAIFLTVAPFLLLEVAERRGAGRGTRGLCAGLGLVLIALFVPDLVRLPTRWAAAPAALWSESVRALLSAGVCVVVPGGLALLAAPSLRPRPRALGVTAIGAVLGAAVAVLLLDPQVRREGRRGAAAVESAQARVEGLRWLREHTPEAGAFERSGPNHTYAVACAPELGTRVAYHGRRPVLGAVLGGQVLGADPSAIAAGLASTDPAAQSRLWAAERVRYLVVEREAANDFDRGSLAWRAATHTEGVGSRALPGFELVFVSPALSIWRVDPPPLEREAPSLRAGPR